MWTAPTRNAMPPLISAVKRYYAQSLSDTKMRLLKEHLRTRERARAAVREAIGLPQRPWQVAALFRRAGCLTVRHRLCDFVAGAAWPERLANESGIRFHVATDRETGVEDLANVTVHRGLSDDAVLSLYQGSDVLFLPLESLASGLPAVTTDLPSVPRLFPGRRGSLAERGRRLCGLYGEALAAGW